MLQPDFLFVEKSSQSLHGLKEEKLPTPEDSKNVIKESTSESSTADAPSRKQSPKRKPKKKRAQKLRRKTSPCDSDSDSSDSLDSC